MLHAHGGTHVTATSHRGQALWMLHVTHESATKPQGAQLLTVTKRMGQGGLQHPIFEGVATISMKQKAPDCDSCRTLTRRIMTATS